MELNAEQIKKALELCKTPSANDCEACEYDGKCLKNGEYIGCVNLLIADALSLIKELTEKNERLKCHVNRLKKYDEERDIALHARLISETRADTVRKMQERLKEAFEHSGLYGVDAIERRIDQIAKEMLEGTDD